MKLYEFTYTSNANQSETEVLERVADILETECIEQSWEPDYKFNQCKSVEQLPTGQRRYYFEVIGRYADQEGDETSSGSADQTPKSSGLVASDEMTH